MRKFLYTALLVFGFGVFGQGPIAYYPFNGNAKDESGNGVHGTPNTGTSLDMDRFGSADQAYSFNGVDGYIDLGNSHDFATEDFSVSVWFYRNTGGVGNARIFSKGAGNDGISGYALFGSETGISFTLSKGDGTLRPITGGSIIANQWVHAVCVRDGADIRLYINGDLASSGVGVKESVSGTSRFYIGDNDGQSVPFPGLVDDIRIYNRALSGTEISTLFQEGAFITTWETTVDNEQITIPINESYTYDYTVDWGDGEVVSGFTGSVSHTYATAGTYEVSIFGDFPAINFSNPAANGSQNQIQTIEQWGDINWFDFTDAFNGCSNLQINATDAPDLTNVTSLFGMFSNTNFSADFTNWDVSTITTMEEMFAFSAFNGAVSNWDVSNVTSMRNMFSNATSFNQDISAWDVSLVTDLYGMFAFNTAFNQDISSWNVSNVETTGAMFWEATEFDQNISSWDVSSVLDMHYMFNGAVSFNQDISGWSVSQLVNLDQTFNNASSFDHNLGSWDISSLVTVTDVFSNSGISITNYENTLQGWATLDAGEIQIPTGLTLGASGVSFCDGASRDELISNYTWTFSGDAQNCPDLIAQYLFSGSAIDYSDYGFDATVFEAELTTDRFGFESDAYRFDGENDKISVEATNQSPTNLTMSAWFTFPEAGGDGTHQILEIDGAAVLAVADHQFQAVLNLNGEFRTLQTPVPHSEWNLGTFTYDGTTFRAYLNGVLFAELVNAGPIGYANASSPINIGMSAFSGSYFNGSIDDVSVYGRALTDVEIADLYNDRGYESPRVALATIYSALDGDNWVNNTNWNSEVSMAEWHGITMSNGLVTRLLLQSNNLNGNIPVEIAELTNLERLNFFNNAGITGNIPAEIGNLSNLTFLSLQACSLTGSIPTELGNLTNLTYLVLGPNELTGAVPASFSNLVNVTIFAIHNNQLTSLPDLTGMPATAYFWVQNNKFGFDDLIVNLAKASSANASFGPQTADDEETLTVIDTEEVTLTTSEVTPNTNYQWYFNEEEIVGAVQQDYNFSYDASYEGEYYVVMTNDDVPDVTITRASYLVRDEVNSAPTNLSFADGTFDGVLKEGLPIGTLAGVLVTEDVDPVDSYTYTFVSGPGDGFNSSFTISNDSVFTAVELDPITAPVLQFRVRSTDAGGEFVENTLAIQVSPIQVCNYDVLTASSGSFEDGSGIFDYENDFSCSWLIELSPENQVRLSFSEFDIEQGYDFVRVYDGRDATGTLLGQFSGSTIPEAIISSSNTLFITFISDYITVGSGWTANYSTITPVAYYPFAGDSQDMSGNGNHGTVTNATLVGDRYGNANEAYSFDGSTSFIQASSTFSGTNVPFTIATWVRWNGGSLQEIVSWWNATSTSKVYLGPQASGELRFGDGFGSTGAFIPQNEWVHIAATYDGSVAYIYINGVLSAQSSSGVTQDFAGGDLFIGKQGTNDFEYFDGLIDDLRIYDISLSANEIANLYATSVTDVLAVYNFNGDLSDETGNGFDAINLTSGNAFANSRLGVGNTAYDFDITSGGAIELQNTAGYDFGTEITVSAWIRPDTYNAGFIQLIGNEDAGNGFQFYLDASDLDATDLLTKRRIYAGIPGDSYGAFGEVLLDRWTHVAFRYQQNVGTSLFINGENQGTNGAVPEMPGVRVSASPITIGTDYDGLMDEIKIFNVALTDEEVYEEFNSNRWPFATLAFRGPEGAGVNTIDRLVPLNPSQENTHLAALQLDFDGDYQFRASASDGFEAFMGDNELDGIAEPGATQIALTEGFYAIGFAQSNFQYFVEPITSVGIVGSALTGDGTGWNSDIDLTALGNGIYQITNLNLYDGEFKLRINDDWNYIDWGSNNLDGTLDYRGDNIPITAGDYTLTFDLLNNKYTIIDVASSEAVAELDFSGNLIDDSGFGNDGTSSSSTFTSGRFGSENTALVLNGSGNVNFGNDASINLSNGFTMNLWINPTENTSASELFASSGSFHNHLYESAIDWRYFQGGEEKQINGIPVSTPVGSWTMITWVYDGGQMKFYDDGVLVHASTVFGDIDVTASSYTFGNGYNGSIDALQWVDGVLTDKEIQYLYTDNLILDYALDGNTDDQSGNNINGFLPNGGTYIDDRFGNFTVALGLDGTNQYIEVDNADQPLITGNEITFEGWFQAYDLTGGAFLLNTPGMNAYVDDAGTLGLIIKSADASFAIESSVPIALDEWFHFAGTYDGSVRTIYINGVETASDQIDQLMNIDVLESTTIGGNGSSNFAGFLDDVSIYNYALNASEIAERYGENNFASPRVSGVFPTSGAPGSTIRIYGDNFNQAGTFVNVGGNEVTPTIVNDNLLYFEVPDIGSGNQAVSVSNNFDTSLAQQFTVLNTNELGLSFGASNLITSDVTTPVELHSTDLNGDGYSDLLVASQSEGELTIHLNNADGTFGLPTTIFQSSSTGSLGLSNIKSGDLDGDGDIDIVFSYLNNLYWFENDGAGTMLSTVLIAQLASESFNFKDVQIGDINQDGALDIVVTKSGGSTIDWYRNDGNGNFISEGVISSSPAANKLSLNDFDNDGDLDIAQANTTNFILLNDGFGAFTRTDLDGTATSGYNSVITADFNGDDLMDMFAGSQNDHNVDLYFNSVSTPTDIRQSGDGNSPYDFSIGDIDGDGDIDLITAFYGGNLTLYLNNGSASFSSQVIDANVTSLSRVSASDIDNDGDLDIFTSQESGQVSWFENQIPSDRKEILSYDLSTGPTPSDTEYTYLGEFEGSRYYQFNTAQTWTDAKTIAESLGGHLAIVHSEEENNFITDDTQSVWIGGTDEDVEGVFRWVDGTPLDYTNWATSEPNGGTTENYIQLNADGSWNDLLNDALPFIVEIPFYEGVIDPANNSVSVEVPFETDVSSLVANFQLSNGASAEVNEVAQESGVSINDFSSDITYLVTAEDGTFKNWTVSVSVDDGLLAFYPFNDNASDESGNGFDATVDGPLSTEDRFGNSNSAYYFDGIDDEITRLDTDLIGGEYEVSAVLWLNPAKTDVFQDVLSFGNIRAYLDESGNIIFQLFIDNSSLGYSSEIEVGVWQQIALVYDGNTVKVYKDATLISEIDTYGAIDANVFNMYFGRNIDGNFYEGALDDVSVYNRALSESEILSLYNENGWPPLSTETDILTFNVENERQKTIDPASHTVDILVDFNSEVSAISPSFTLSEGAIVTVNDNLQVSGSSINDFTSPVTYSVTAEDNATMQDWLVTIERDSIQGDSLALVALYNATDGDNWTTSWDLAQPITTWVGVDLDENRRVIAIDVAQRNLVGTLPAEIKNLSELRSLYLWSNNISGDIPTEVTQLSKLQNLGLNANQLTGTIPSSIGNLSNLVYLDLSSNGLTGSIPASLGSLSVLNSLYLNENNLSGSIPTQLGNLPNLSVLHLSYNNLSGSIPISLGNIGSSLEYLYLSGNSLIGSIPNEFGSLTDLIQLTLNENQLSGNIPDIFGSFTNLSFLNVSNNNLSGSIPISLGSLSSLEFLDLSTNDLTGDIPSEFNGLTKLRFFRVQSNKLESLPVMTGSPLDEGLSIEENKIGFTDIQANLSITNFNYNPQTVDDTVRLLVSPEAPVLMSTSETASGTNFQWQKDDIAIDGATASTLEVTEPGRYTVVMTNDNVLDLTITRAPYILTGSNATEILSFSFDGFESEVVFGNGTIDIEVPFGSPSQSSLIAVFELSPGASAEIGGTPQESGVTVNDFNNDVTYTITALDGVTTQNWVVSTTAGPNPANDIENFDIANMVGDEAINFDNHTVSITMPYNTDRSALTPFIAVSSGASIDPLSNVPQDFTSTFNYTVTSESGVAQGWTVDVANELNNETDITSFVIPNQVVDESIDVDNHTVLIRMPFGTNVTALTPSIELSAGATVNPASGTARDFTNPVVYNVIPEDNSASQAWTVTVEVDASPNSAPTALNLDNSSIDENTVGLVGSLATTDADATDSHIYSLINGIGATDNLKFSLSDNQLSSLEAFDFETQSSYSILVRTDDQRGGKFDQQFTINVADVNEAPTIADQIFTVDENTVSGFVGDVVANDVDANTNLTFSIVNGITAFDISSTGSIIVSDGDQLDFETTPSFDLTVQVSDGALTAEATITINLNDVNDAPIISDQTFTVEENTSNGTQVGIVVATDQDENISGFTITSGNTNNAFTIDNSGSVTVNDESILDFEVNPTFSLTINVSDGDLSDEAIITINLTDVNEAPIVEDQLFSIAENATNGTSVGTVETTDEDNNVSAFTITTGNTNDAFAIDNAGVITVNDATILDFEVNPTFNLTINVSDGSLTDEAVITINLNDVNEAPIITDQTFSIDENSSNGTEVGTVVASDQDENIAAFAITSGNTSSAFAIDNAGIIRVNDVTILDFETNPQFVLTIAVTDAGATPLTDEADITINLNDLNENVAPSDITFSPDNNSENTATGSVIGTLSSTDADENNTHTYSLISGDISDFEIIGSELRNTVVFDFETQSSYVMTIRSTDQNDAFYEEEMTINIVNVNEATTISLSGSNITEYEIESGGFTITTTITDEDGFLSREIFYKKVTQSTYSKANLVEGTNNAYTFDFVDANLDNVGLEYYIQTEDIFNDVQQSATKVVATKVASDAVDITNKVKPGTSVSNYTILAFPFEGVSVSNVFSDLGVYQNDWRLIRWNNGEYQDLQSGSVSPGVGYWFITKTTGNINTGGKSVTLTDGAYKVNLNPSGASDGGQGFTLIGNPFQGTINWTDVIQYNIDRGNITSDQVQSTLIGYNGEFTNKTTLGAFEGAFIQSNSGISNFVIPASAVTSGGGREEQVNSPNDVFIDDNNWGLDLFFHTPSYNYSIGGIGISQTAKDGRDINDLGILPRLELYLDLLFEDGSTRSIKKSDDYKTWSFQVRNNLPESEIDMTWDIPVSSHKTIILVDGASKQIYDLKETRSIQLKNDPSATHQLYYGDKKTIFDNLDLDFDAFHSTYPNPVENVMTIELYAGNDRDATLSLVGLDGKTLPIGQIQLYKGLNSKMINLEEYSIPAGVYFLKVDTKVTTKILKQ